MNDLSKRQWADSDVYHGKAELREGYDDIPEDERGTFEQYMWQMEELGLYVEHLRDLP